MEIFAGLSIIALGALFQSSSYVPIKRIKGWSWESFWLIQGIFAWLVFPLCGALLAVPEGESLFALFRSADAVCLWLTLFFGALWGVGGLTFGLSMRYLGIALGQSVSLGTCAALGTILGPVMLSLFFPEGDYLSRLTWSVISGVAVTLVGIGVIGCAGAMKSRSAAAGQQGSVTKEFDFLKGMAIALLAGTMSGCFNVGLEFGAAISFDASPGIYHTLPATFLVTAGGFVTNAAYCLYQNRRNSTYGDYLKSAGWMSNLCFCAIAGLLWYSQFFGLSLGKSFLSGYPTLVTFSWCILMALNVIFSNVWGIILKEWSGTTRLTKAVLVSGLVILIISTFLPYLT